MQITADITYTVEMGHQEISTMIYGLRVTAEDSRTPPDTAQKLKEMVLAFESRKRMYEDII